MASSSSAVATDSAHIPPYKQMLWQTVQALRQLGGSGHVDEIARTVIEIGDYTEEQQAVLTPNGRHTKLAYNVHWCLSALKAVGRLENSSRGVWALNESGDALTESEIPALREQITRHYRTLTRERRRQKQAAAVAVEGDDAEDEADAMEGQVDDAWKDELLKRLRAMDPIAFEHLCKRLLRESGFRRVEVTKASGDQGIDGVGVLEIGLVSFRTYFQCKRYGDQVGAKHVRDFRGAMSGRGEKGLLITTGTFSPPAQQEAGRDGVPPIDLVDGDRLCDLLKNARLGVRVETVERITIDRGAFGDATGSV